MPQAGPTDEPHEPPMMMPMMPVREVVRPVRFAPPRCLERVTVPWARECPLGYRVVLASTQPAAVQADAATATPKEGPLLPHTEDSTPGVDQASVHFTPPCASTPLQRVDSLRALPVELVSVGGLSNTHARRPLHSVWRARVPHEY